MELFYNPERMSETEIRETFVAHEWLIDEILAIIRRQPQGAGIQHVVIVAPRGMGKTTMLLMLKFTILNDELSKRWQPILFPEELYGVYDLPDLWIEVLNHVAGETGDADMGSHITALRTDHSRDLEESALAQIRDWTKSNRKRLLLLVDNFDMILEQIGNEKDHAKLRDVLMNEGSLMLIGGSPTFFKEVKAYDQPLYNLFKIYNLNSLSADQIEDLLCRRAKVDGISDFGQILKDNRSRVRVLEYFTGGNPRLVLMLYRVITQAHISEVKRGLEKLLDEVTPYYKAKIETLPPQQRKILDHIARVSAQTREGVTPSEIAKETRLPVNQVSAQLKRLSDIGYVNAANIRARSSYYTLSEPLYAIWHQMRFGRYVRKRMSWLIAFLKGWYDAEQIKSESARLHETFKECMTSGHLDQARDALEYRRYLIEASDSEIIKSSAIDGIVISYLELHDTETVRRELLGTIPPETLSKATRDRLKAAGVIYGDDDAENQVLRSPLPALITEAMQAIKEGRTTSAVEKLRLALEIDPDSVPAQIGLSFALSLVGDTTGSREILLKLEDSPDMDLNLKLFAQAIVAFGEGDYEDAIIKIRGSLEQKPTDKEGWNVLGSLLQVTDRFDDALTAFEQYLTLAPEDYQGWYWKAYALERLDRGEEALTTVDHALTLNPNESDVWSLRSQVLLKLNKIDEGLDAAKRAIELNPQSTTAWYNTGRLLVKQNKYDAALEAVDAGLVLEPASYEMIFLKALVLFVLNRAAEALAAVNRVLEMEPTSGDALLLRACLLHPTEKGDGWIQGLNRAFEHASGKHSWFLRSPEILGLKFQVSVTEGDFSTARRDWEKLRGTIPTDDGGKWISVASELLRQTAEWGHLQFARELISKSDLEEPLFPLARALDYLDTRDEALIEKLSPEVRRIVKEIVATLQKSIPSDQKANKPKRKGGVSLNGRKRN